MHPSGKTFPPGKMWLKIMLYGADNWQQSEFRKTKGGEKQPNSRETWLDVQAQALFQAEKLIKSAIREAAYQYFNQ